ncbi:MAG: hypothetical protein PWQ10_478 [Patescibacteria group bacterium]|nr:hypothetical protein [Patescibacteria group bacterium]
METELDRVESVTKSDLLDLASWEKPRSTEQLRDFVARREAALSLIDFDD